MFEDETSQPIPQAAQTVRGYDRCEKCKYVPRIFMDSCIMLTVYRAQHVKCDGVRPMCRRCRGKGYSCVYVPKRSPWIVYAVTSRASRGTTGHDSDLSLATRPKVLLNPSVDSLPSSRDWSDISVDVHALMHYCKNALRFFFFFFFFIKKARGLNFMSSFPY
jgi:hypothetical protein